MKVAKGLLDYGVHSPTVYFPLTVEEALMIEPTEIGDARGTRRVRRTAQRAPREARAWRARERAQEHQRGKDRRGEGLPSSFPQG